MAIQFTCPQCGTTSSVDESYAGQTGPCANCGASVTIPGGRIAQPGQKSSSSSSTVLIVVLVLCVLMCIPCGGVLVALLLPAVQASREAARRMQCNNNMKQVALGLLNYESTHGTFPPAYIPDDQGQPMHSWRVLILPFMEQQALHSQYNFDEPWDSPSNSAVTMSVPQTYVCPSDPNAGCAYHVINVPDGIFDGAKANKMSSISDGPSSTILVVESVGSSKSWADPTNDLGPAALTTPVNSARNGTCISSYHPGGAMIVRADGSTTFVSDSFAQKVISASVTKSDGQTVQLP